VTTLEATKVYPPSTPSHLPLNTNSTSRSRYFATQTLSTFDNMESSHRLNSKYKPSLHIKKPNKSILTDMDSSLHLPKEYIQQLKAFLLKYDIHKSNRPNTGILYNNPCIQRTSRDRQHDERTHYDIHLSTTPEAPPPQWSRSSLTKKKRYQEQRIFVKRQCVRFVVPGDEDSTASCNDYGDDDEEKDEEDNDGDGNTEARKPWKYSQLAKMFEAYEHNSFKTGLFKGSRPIRHRSVLPYFG
jgi:hypothetical protein